MVSERYISPVPEQSAYSADVVAELRRRLPDWTPDESDPGVYWSDDTAARIIQLINDFNASADANDILKAKGLALRELVRQYGIYDPPDGISDNDLLERVRAQWNSRTEGTEAWDKLQARNASPRVADVSRSPVDWAANTVTMYVVDAEGENLTEAERAGIAAQLNASERPTFWLDYLVPEATVERYLLSGRIVYDRGKADPLAQVIENLQAAMNGLRTLDTGIDESELQAQAWIPDVVRRMELVFNSATTDAAGNLVPGPVVPAFAPALNVVRHGSTNAAVALHPDTEMRMALGASTGIGFGDASLRTGSQGTHTISRFLIRGSERGTYTWAQIDAVGEFSDVVVNQEAASRAPALAIPMTQIAQSETQTLFRSTEPQALGITSGVISLTAARRWPPITSGTEW